MSGQDPQRHPRGGDPVNRGRYSPAEQAEADLARIDLTELPGPDMAGVKDTDGPDGDKARVRIEPHRSETVPWSKRSRGGGPEDRMLRKIDVSLPPMIAAATFDVPSDLVALTDEAVHQITALDLTHGHVLSPLSALLLRAESVATSKIEHVEASVDDYARALHGVKANTSATSMVAATKALSNLVNSVSAEPDGAPVTLDAVLAAHRLLMAEDDDMSERLTAGSLRTEQNWIEGSDHSPLNATYVPPPHEYVEAYIADLVVFANRTDIGVLLQASATHAQFESVHPFTDGNGRIGRSLINTVLRRRGITSNVVVPVASALVARRDDYFDTLDDYRRGDTGPITETLARAVIIAAKESHISAGRLVALREQWQDYVGPHRADSGTAKLLASLDTSPIFTPDDVALRVGSESATYRAIDALATAGVIRSLTPTRTRNPVWGVGSVLDEIKSLGARIATTARRDLRR